MSSRHEQKILKTVIEAEEALYGRRTHIALADETGISRRTPYYWFPKGDKVARLPSTRDLARILEVVQKRKTALDKAERSLAAALQATEHAENGAQAAR